MQEIKTKKFFLDTEFIEYPNTIDLISIGIVCENESELYAVNGGCDTTKSSDWVKENVLLKMPEYDKDNGLLTGMSISQMKEKILSYIEYNCGMDGNCKVRPEFWGYYADYDWVVFCWLFGAMIDLPEGWPMYCRDLKQWADDMGNPNIPKQKYGEHSAIEDARWNKFAHEYLLLHREKRRTLQMKYPAYNPDQIDEMTVYMKKKYSDIYDF